MTADEKAAMHASPRRQTPGVRLQLGTVKWPMAVAFHSSTPNLLGWVMAQGTPSRLSKRSAAVALSSPAASPETCAYWLK
ncbi:MAG: hypothetical protein B7Z37_13125 [Verrucomicrobia bacterium 12-59-8]|nr:MAG: hypothetical protein B7Z37_13125 [Verrucomicrobia bacterium 12-59-8]